MARQFDRLLKGVLRNLCVDKEEAGFCCLLWFSLRNRKKSSALGMCMGAVGYKVDGKGMEEREQTWLLHLHFLMAQRNAERVWIQRCMAAGQEE